MYDPQTGGIFYAAGRACPAPTWAVRNLSHIQIRVLCVLLNKLPSRLDLLAHQDAERLVRTLGILDFDLHDDAVVGVHRGLPQLVGVHLAQTLEPGDIDLDIGISTFRCPFGQ